MTMQTISPERTALPAVIEQTASRVFEGFSQRFRQALNGRQERALKLALGGHVSHKAGRVFSVRSEDGKRAYLVDLDQGSCTCPDYRNGNVCKHRIAAYLIEQANAASQEEPARDKVEVARLVLNARSDLLREAVIYATIQHDGKPLPVEVVHLEGDIATVRALPRAEEGRLAPRFPFQGQSSATILARSLMNVAIYRQEASHDG